MSNHLPLSMRIDRVIQYHIDRTIQSIRYKRWKRKTRKLTFMDVSLNSEMLMFHRTYGETPDVLGSMDKNVLVSNYLDIQAQHTMCNWATIIPEYHKGILKKFFVELIIEEIMDPRFKNKSNSYMTRKSDRLCYHPQSTCMIKSVRLYGKSHELVLLKLSN